MESLQERGVGRGTVVTERQELYYSQHAHFCTLVEYAQHPRIVSLRLQFTLTKCFIIPLFLSLWRGFWELDAESTECDANIASLARWEKFGFKAWVMLMECPKWRVLKQDSVSAGCTSVVSSE